MARRPRRPATRRHAVLTEDWWDGHGQWVQLVPAGHRFPLVGHRSFTLLPEGLVYGDRLIPARILRIEVEPAACKPDDPAV